MEIKRDESVIGILIFFLSSQFSKWSSKNGYCSIFNCFLFFAKLKKHIHTPIWIFQ